MDFMIRLFVAQTIERSPFRDTIMYKLYFYNI